MMIELLHDALACRLLSDASCRVFAVLCMNDPSKIRSVRLLRELSGVQRPNRCLDELSDAGLVFVARNGARRNRLVMSRPPVADFHAWRMLYCPETELRKKDDPLLYMGSEA